jgi:membrane fusion protein, multidrug efflux system
VITSPRLSRLLPLSVLLLASCGGGVADLPTGDGAGDGASADRNLVEVLSTAVVSKPLGTDIEAIGTATANESVEITSKVTNTIKAIRFDEGTRVKRGAVLVELDDDEARADVAEAEAVLTDSESQYRRSRELVAQQALSQSQLDTIQSALQANRARLAAARARLDDTLIRAGFDGRTGFRRVSVGALVTPGTVITTLDDTSVIKLSFTVPETELSALQVGLPVAATTVGLPGRTFKGTITQLATRVDPVSRSIGVRAEIPNRDGSLRPGMFMTAALSGRVMPALTVPEGAIVPERGESYVFLVRDGRVERRRVQTGRRRPGEVEIVTGLAQGDRVVVEGTQHVSDGTRVREREFEAQTAPRGSSAR